MDATLTGRAEQGTERGERREHAKYYRGIHGWLCTNQSRLGSEGRNVLAEVYQRRAG